LLLASPSESDINTPFPLEIRAAATYPGARTEPRFLTRHYDIAEPVSPHSSMDWRNFIGAEVIDDAPVFFPDMLHPVAV
jgi:hypothetical protein